MIGNRETRKVPQPQRWRRIGYLAVAMILVFPLFMCVEAKGQVPDLPNILRKQIEPKERMLDRIIASPSDLYKIHDAIPVAAAVEDIRRRWQGNSWWETSQASQRLRHLKRLESLRPAERERLIQAGSIQQRVDSLCQQGHYGDALKLYESQPKIIKEVWGEDDPVYAGSLNVLANLYFRQARYGDAEPLFLQALAICKNESVANHPTYALYLSNLANLYSRRGSYGQAEPLYKQALAIRRETLGERDRDYALTLNDLASLYDAQARYVDAEPLYRQVLAIQKQTLGEDHPAYAVALSSLASICESEGRYFEAEPLYVQALAIRKKVSGEQNPMYVASVNHLGWLYQEEGRYREAEVILKETIDTQAHTEGAKGEDYSTSLGDLAIVYQKEGKYEDAEPLLLSAIAIDDKASGKVHLHYATSLNNLASLYDDEGKFESAETLYRQSLTIQKQSLRASTPAYARGLRNLAVVYEDEGRFAEADPLLREALEIRRTVFGEEHPLYASSLRDLASEYEAQGRRAEAEPLLRKTLAIQKLTLGEDHSEYATSLSHLASLYEWQGRYADAESLYRQALAIRKKALGENHPAYAASLDNLATVYKAQGHYDQAEVLYKQGSDIRKKTFGEAHPAYATSLLDLAGLYEAQGRFADAEPFYRQAVAIQQRTLGEEHPKYAHSLGYLSINLAATGHWQEAAQLQLEAAHVRWKHLANNLGAFAPSEQAQWLRTGTPDDAGLLFGLVFSGHASGEQGMQAVLWRKQLGMEALRQQTSAVRGVVAHGTPEWQDAWRRLQESRREYAALSLRLPDNGRLSQSGSLLTTGLNYSLELKQRVEAEEVKLRQSNPVYAQLAHVQDVRIEDLRRALSSDQALVEYVRYRPVNYKARSGPAHYGVFIVRGDKREIQAIEVGAAGEIDSLVKQYHDKMDEATKRFQISPSPPQLQASESDLGNISTQLRAKIWVPLEVALQGFKRIYIAPDGDLSLMPFEALATQRPEGGWHYLAEDRELVYVGTGRDLARLAVNARPDRSNLGVPGRQRAVLVGAPAFGATPRELAAASGTEPSVESVMQIGEDSTPSKPSSGAQGVDSLLAETLGGLPASFPEIPELKEFTSKVGQSLAKHGWEVETLEGRGASKRAVLALQHPDLLQFASHGFFLDNKTFRKAGAAENQDKDQDYDALLRSALILAGYNHRLQEDHVFYRVGNELLSKDTIRQRGLTEDKLAGDRVDVGNGILTAYEVTGMDLEGTRLVNLTACETGLGAVTAEGVVGLREGFLLAGARALTMSMWQVPADEVTHQILTFYNRWLNNASPTSLYKAFHQSQLAALKSARQAHGASHPFYWAGTVYAGDPGDLPVPDQAN